MWWNLLFCKELLTYIFSFLFIIYKLNTIDFNK